MENIKSKVIPRGTDEAIVIQVIRTRSMKGAGTEKDPVRTVVQFWDFEGNLLAKNDPYLEGSDNL